MFRVDLHCDTITMMRRKETIEHSHCRVSLQNLKESETLMQCFAAFIPAGYFPAPVRVPIADWQFERIYGQYQRMLRQHSEEFRPVLYAADLEACRQEGRIGALLTLEDGGILGSDIRRVGKFFDLGVRLVTLTWNAPNTLGYPQSKHSDRMEKGLTSFGLQVVEEMECLGMAVDVSHLSDGGFWDVMKHVKKPPLASHSCARALRNHPRNLTDDMIRALAEKGGIIGINFCPQFLGEGKNNRVEDIVRHMDHIVRVGGDSVLALGSDFDGIGGQNEVGDPADCEKLWQALKKAGFSEKLLEKIWWKNAAQYWGEVLPGEEVVQ